MPEYTDWILREDRIARLTLNRAQQHNTLRRETFQQLREITRRLRDRNDIWAVIVDSAGKHFSSGVDVRVIGELVGQQAGAFRESLRDLQNYLDEFEQLEKATIARLHGYCLGGGLLLALCCDFRVAATDAVFGFPEVKRSIAVLMGTQRITRVTGVATTKEMVLLAENFNAERARQCGLLHRVVPPQELEVEAVGLAEGFLQLPPRAVAIAKRIIDRGYELPLRESQDLEIDSQLELLRSADLREALDSLFEKRQPNFSGE
jgi:enoyl-CoA hydratase/carnithine racemase